MLSITGAGTVIVRASALGGTSDTGVNYRPADDVDQAFVVAQAGQSISFGPLANKTVGAAPFAVNATASSGLAVSFSIVSGPATIAGNMVTVTGAGIVKVRASQPAAPTTWPTVPVDQSFTVISNASSVVVASSKTPALAGVPITLTATVSPTGATGAVSLQGRRERARVRHRQHADGAGGDLQDVVAGGRHALDYGGLRRQRNAVGQHLAGVLAGDQPVGEAAGEVRRLRAPGRDLEAKVAQVPASNALIKVFATSNACTGNLFKAIHPKKWGEIFDGARRPRRRDGCPAVSIGRIRRPGRPTRTARRRSSCRR